MQQIWFKMGNMSYALKSAKKADLANLKSGIN